MLSAIRLRRKPFEETLSNDDRERDRPQHADDEDFHPLRRPLERGMSFIRATQGNANPRCKRTDDQDDCGKNIKSIDIHSEFLQWGLGLPPNRVQTCYGIIQKSEGQLSLAAHAAGLGGFEGDPNIRSSFAPCGFRLAFDEPGADYVFPWDAILFQCGWDVGFRETEDGSQAIASGADEVLIHVHVFRRE